MVSHVKPCSDHNCAKRCLSLSWGQTSLSCLFLVSSYPKGSWLWHHVTIYPNITEEVLAWGSEVPWPEKQILVSQLCWSDGSYQGRWRCLLPGLSHSTHISTETKSVSAGRASAGLGCATWLIGLAPETLERGRYCFSQGEITLQNPWCCRLGPGASIGHIDGVSALRNLKTDWYLFVFSHFRFFCGARNFYFSKVFIND